MSDPELDEALIEDLVHTFYGRIREDALLGPIFDAKIHDWDVHLGRMCAFWSSVMLSSGRYRGQPMRMHLPLPVDAQHFDRWLELFRAVARERCGERVAEAFIARAEQIAQSLEFGVASASGVVLTRGQRFVRAPAAERRRLL